MGAFYRFVNGKLSCKSGVGPLKSPSGEVIVSDSDKAELLNDYFTGVFTVDDGVLPEIPLRVQNNMSMSKINFSSVDVLKIISKTTNSKTADPHGFSNFFLKRLQFILASPLSSVYAHIFSAGVIPDAWRTANVTPIFKKGVSSQPSNYRPISLTSLFSKIFERVIKQQVLSYLQRNGLITQQQFGFLSKHSTESQLLDCVNDWTLSIRNHCNVDVVYFDFNKAFDTVSHPKLIHKLKAYGLSGSLLDVLSDFLKDRVQRVVLPNGVSTFRAVTSGVPQGSVLGPILFLLYINDIVDLFYDSNVKIKLYADDIKIYLEITGVSDVVMLQNKIDKILDWSDTWQLKVATDKCHHNHLSVSSVSCPADYFVSHDKLPVTVNVRDLGVLVDSRLTFKDHITSIVSRGHLRAMQIWRCFLCKDYDILIKAFITYVRPLLEYCSTVWSPSSATLVDKLESVQRGFTKRLPGLQSFTYDQRCARLGIDRLELRRLHADLILCYKILHGLIALPWDRFFSITPHHSTRGHSYKLFLPESRIRCRQHFFAVRVVKIWNSLPDDVVSVNCLSAFVRELKRQDLSLFLIGKS